MNNLNPTPNYGRLIFEFRGTKVMIDADLATLYEVETKRLKQQVKRNLSRFPNDFMFQLTKAEKGELVANCDRLANLKFSSANPFVFTEQGVAMLSSILRSEKAIQINIDIMRAFAMYRSMLKENETLKNRIDNMEAKMDDGFQFLLEKIDALTPSSTERRKRIGFLRPDELEE